MAGQVQMVYFDPPYGIRYGSNFQPFVNKRDVKDGKDEDLTAEPEMIKAFRDTWELGIHSYLGYLRDRLLLARDLLDETGSVFVQISDENVHHVRELMDEVFGSKNFVSLITVQKTTSASGPLISIVADYLIWYAKDSPSLKTHSLFLERAGEGWVNYEYVALPDGTYRRMTSEERSYWSKVPKGAKIYRRDNLTSQRPAQAGDLKAFVFEGREYRPGKGTFKTDLEGLERLRDAGRLEAYGDTLAYRRFAVDFPYRPLSNLWTDTLTGGYAEERSTGDMGSWYTGKPCELTSRSHINFCVFDSTWEASESFILDKHPKVSAWVKNDHLGFEVLYVSKGVVRKYRPDFLIRLTDGATLILEVKGQDSPENRTKREFLAEWVRAVNEHGGFGHWVWDVSFHPKDVNTILKRHSKAGDL